MQKDHGKFEIRRALVAASIEGRRLVGFAARYNEIAEIGQFRERIAVGAFRNSLGESSDILALLDHDPCAVLGRTRTGTLKLEDRAEGLAFDVALPDTTAGRDALALAERGDLGGASIGFIVENEEKDGQTRVILEARLFEISIVSSWPAYGQTSVEARCQKMTTPFLVMPQTPRLDAAKRYLETL